MTFAQALQVLSSFGLPILVVLCGAASQALINNEWFKLAHFKFGLELSIAGICLCYTIVFDLIIAEMTDTKQIFPVQGLALISIASITTFGIFMYLMILYQSDRRVEQTTGTDPLNLRYVLILDLLGAVPLVGITVILLRAGW
jgi:hypothetical protein